MQIMNVVKRDGSKVEYDGQKIKNAVHKAMLEGEGVDKRVIDEIEKEIREEIANEFHQGLFTVEMISDMAEDKLLRKGFVTAGRRYIIYRHERKNERENGDRKLKSKYFSPEFLKKYRYAKEPFEPLGAFVFARTYARWLPEESRRETWYEVVKRAVEFNLSLAKHTKEEAEQLFHNVFYLKQNLSGRMTWLGGVPTAHSNALGLFNCAFDIADSFDTFVEGFTVLMLGAGLGVRILKEDVEKIPEVRNGIDLINRVYDPVPKRKRKEYTSLIEHDKATVEIEIADSRGGWTEALDIYFNLLWNVKYKEVNTIILNFNNIREKGDRIKGFGGKSAGSEPLMDMFTKIHKVLQQGDKKTYKIKTIDALDIINLIALNVVSGNVRRSSIMVTCAPDDYDIINAKSNLYTQINGEWLLDKSIEHRQMSNNTVLYTEKPDRKQWAEHFSKMRYSGEPAFANLSEMLKRNPNAKGLNPCGRLLCLM